MNNPVVTSGSASFSSANELVIIAKSLTGSITADNASNLLNAIDHGSYSEGESCLFIVNNGIDTGLFRFASANTDSVIDGLELTLIGVLQGNASTGITDYYFG